MIQWIMRYINHKKIKAFTQDLTVKSSALIEKQRTELVRHMQNDMREAGYIPALDIGENYTSDRDYNTGAIKVTVTVYGVFVGKEKAWRLEGIEISNSGRVYPLVSRETKANSLEF